MDFWAAILVVLRRWYVVLPVFGLTLAGSYVIYQSMAVQYTSTSMAMLTVPTTGAALSTARDRPNPITNPLLNFNDGLKVSAAVLVQSLSTPEVAAQLGIVPGGPTSYAVNNGHPNPELLVTSPFLLVEGKSTDPKAARDIIRKVMARAKIELVNRQRQLGATRQTFITLTEMYPPTEATAVRDGMKKAMAAVLLVGLLTAIMSAFAAESVVAAWARRKKKAAPPSSELVVHEQQPSASDRRDLPVVQHT